MRVIIILFLIFYYVLGEDECKRPVELKIKEEYCWTEEVEVVDKIVQTSKSVLNFAKKKLGIGNVEENEKQKCDYYLCILRQLHMLNANDYPACENIKEWSKNYVVYNQAIDFMEHLDKCYDALTNSTVREVYFYADEVEEDDKSSEESSETKTTTIKPEENKEQNGAQTVCDIASEFIKCLSRQKKCPVFQYP